MKFIQLFQVLRETNTSVQVCCWNWGFCPIGEDRRDSSKGLAITAYTLVYDRKHIKGKALIKINWNSG